MSAIDTAWLRTDRPTNPMVIAGVLLTEGRLAFERFREIIATNFLRHARFRDRVAFDGDSAHWESDPNFDLSFHVRRTALPRPGGKKELYELVGDLMSSPLDRARPLWQFQLVEHYGRGSAIVARIHHCYADGVVMMQVLLSMTGDPEAPAEPDAGAAGEAHDDLLQRWFGPLGKAVNDALKIGSGLVEVYVDALLHPGHALDYARRGIDLTAEAARLALMSADSPTRFKGTPRGVKRAAWTERLALSEVKALAHAAGCSINDVLMACAAGALRGHLLDQGDPVEGVEVRALVPVNMRGQDGGGPLGNYFGGVFVQLPLGIDNPMQRLYELKRRMAELKGSAEPLFTLGLMAAVGMGPKALQQEVIDMLASRCSLVLTNVPGPQRPLYMGGRRLREIVFWVPQSGAIGLGISVLSYDGGIQCGVVADTSLVEDPEDIARRFRSQFEQMLWIALMGSWDGPPDPGEAAALLG
ncbi:MAG TPA: wax ester/triacylglycerol synthase family O-acyltransferase [Burkholderiales bacterium]|nr:wax ester/triacylglycerol synthase family O-acyltransferase [Burkholderiales bacterium]